MVASAQRMLFSKAACIVQALYEGVSRYQSIDNKSERDKRLKLSFKLSICSLILKIVTAIPFYCRFVNGGHRDFVFVTMASMFTPL